MKQPASHKDIDFGQTLYACISYSDKQNVVIVTGKVCAIDKECWRTENNTLIKYVDTYYNPEDAITAAAEIFSILITIDGHEPA